MQRQRKKDMPETLISPRAMIIRFFFPFTRVTLWGAKAFPHFHTPCIMRGKTFRAISCLLLKLVENPGMILMEILTLERRKLCCSSRENFIAFHLRKQIVINLMAWIIHLESDYGESSRGTCTNTRVPSVCFLLLRLRVLTVVRQRHGNREEQLEY